MMRDWNQGAHPAFPPAARSAVVHILGFSPMARFQPVE